MKIGGRRPPFPDAELIRSLAALLAETGLTEIEYAIGDRRIRVARTPGAPATTPLAPAQPHATSLEHPGAVKAPMVGTAYLAPQPGDPPFVRLGDIVAEGQPLLIRRESFRHHSYVSLAANGVICGLGPQGYELALEAIAAMIEGESGEADR